MSDLSGVPEPSPTSPEVVDDGALPGEVVAPPMAGDEKDEYARRLMGYENTQPQYE